MNVATSPLLPGTVWKPPASCLPRAFPGLVALLRHDERTIRADGSTRHVRYEERFFRDADRVLIERVLPRAARALAERHPASAEPRVRQTARLIMRGSEGEATLALVSVAEGLIIDVEPADYGDFGFDGRFDTASCLFDSGALDRLVRTRRGRAGTWYAAETPHGDERVLWSEELGLALARVVTSVDGLTRNRLNVRVVAANPEPDHFPWSRLQGFRRISLSQLGE